MKNTKTKIWVNILLDESGSMCDCTEQTIEEFNSFINEQKKIKDATVLATLTTFEGTAKHLYIARPVEQVPKLSRDNYNPTGCTALYDAIAASMKTVDESMRREDEKTGVLFVIISDGQENSSSEFRGQAGLKAIQKMITEKKEKGWTFVFIGADIDAWSGESLGIISSIGTKKANTKAVYAALSAGTAQYASAIDRGDSVADFFELSPEEFKGLND